MIQDIFLCSQVSRNQIGREIWTNLKKLFTIRFQLRNRLHDLDDCTAEEKGPFVLDVFDA